MVTRDTAWPEGTPCWVDLGVSDIPKAIAFYSDLFDWDIPQGPPETGGYSVASLDGYDTAGIGPKMGPAEAPSMWMVYLASDDADATAAKATKAGGTLLMEPMDVMEFGRMAVATDITGAVFGIWQGRKQTGIGLANAPGALTWNEHLSRDFEGAKAFYAAVFGYEYGDMSSDQFTYATLLLSGHEVGGIGAYPAGTPGNVPAAWSTYFGTSETDESVVGAVEHGGTIVREPADSPYGRVATVADDQGAVFSLISVPPGD
jgi:hypothetical protein